MEQVTGNAGAAVINTESATITDLCTPKEHNRVHRPIPSTWSQLGAPLVQEKPIHL